MVWDGQAIHYSTRAIERENEPRETVMEFPPPRPPLFSFSNSNNNNNRMDSVVN